MKNLTRVALVGCLISIALHGYLTMHFYPLNFGAAEGPSMCNMSEKFNCDAVTASSFSSFQGVPIAAFGLVTNFVIFMLLLLSWIGWTEYPERMRRWGVTLAGISVGASVVMASISAFQIGKGCPFCMAIYIFSFLIFECARRTLQEPYFKGMADDLPNMWAQSQNILWAFVSVPVLAYIVHTGMMQNYGAEQMDRLITAMVNDWTGSPVKEFTVKPLLTAGPEKSEAKMTISEYADFRCHHCKNAANSLHAFTAAHSDVRYEYFAFPLDGNCSTAETTRISCQLAFGVYCAQIQNKGWQMHDAVYAAQDKTLRMDSPDQLKEFWPEIIKTVGVDSDTFMKCMEDPVTHDAIAAQSKQGALHDVRGTPTIFANSKLLGRGQLIPVLEKARDKVVR